MPSEDKNYKNNKTENYLIKTNNHQGLMASWIWQYTNIQDARLWEEREYLEWEREERGRGDKVLTKGKKQNART